jgi:hypothetical protein
MRLMLSVAGEAEKRRETTKKEKSTRRGRKRLSRRRDESRDGGRLGDGV